MLTCKLSGVRTLAEIMTFLQFAKMYNIVFFNEKSEGANYNVLYIHLKWGFSQSLSYVADQLSLVGS